MVALQILCKCLAEGNIDIIELNQLTEDYFTGYEEERNFIVDHYKQYGNTPDKATFISKFPDVDLVTVEESDKYLVDAIREEHLFYKSVPIVQKIAELLNSDANAAVEYMLQATTQLQPNYGVTGTNIIADAKKRYNEFLERKYDQNKWFFASGFPELDDAIHGIQRIEEFILIYARTNMGKSYLLEVIIENIWKQGNNVGYFSPEMSASSIGYRFDTINRHFDNSALIWGKESIVDEEYKDYIDKLAHSEYKFMVTTPADFDHEVTITKLKNWVKQNDLKAIALDGITYLTDERARKSDNEAKQLTHIGEDLMALSVELGIPVLGVVQANRGGVTDKDNNDTPELENVRGGDGLSFNASKVLALKQNEDQNLILQVKKQRNGFVGKKIIYHWDPNHAIFEYIPTSDESRKERTGEKGKKRSSKKESKEDIF